MQKHFVFIFIFFRSNYINSRHCKIANSPRKPNKNWRTHHKASHVVQLITDSNPNRDYAISRYFPCLLYTTESAPTASYQIFNYFHFHVWNFSLCNFISIFDVQFRATREHSVIEILIFFSTPGKTTYLTCSFDCEWIVFQWCFWIANRDWNSHFCISFDAMRCTD